MQNRYFLMRHGESVANLANRIVSFPEHGLEANGLSPLGFEQARKSAGASGLPRDTLVVASDFLRTRQTAEAACQALSMAAPTFDARLRERGFGTLEGSSGDEYRSVWTEDERDPSHTLFGVEPAVALARRLLSLWQELDAAHRGRNILLVSHGDPLRFLQLAATARPLTEHLQVRLFAPAEIRPLQELPRA